MLRQKNDEKILRKFIFSVKFSEFSYYIIFLRVSCLSIKRSFFAFWRIFLRADAIFSACETYCTVIRRIIASTGMPISGRDRVTSRLISEILCCVSYSESACLYVRSIMLDDPR